MKKIMITLLLILPFVQSCKKEKQTEIRDNFVSFNLNGTDCIGKSEINYNRTTKKLTILGVREGANSDVLVIRLIFNGPGKYILQNNDAYYYTLVGGDVITNSYQLESSITGNVDLAKFDESANTVEGTFDFNLKKNPKNSAPSASENANIVSGVFKGKINLFSE